MKGERDLGDVQNAGLGPEAIPPPVYAPEESPFASAAIRLNITNAGGAHARRRPEHRKLPVGLPGETLLAFVWV